MVQDPCMFSLLYIDDEPGLLEIGKMFLEQGGQFSVDTVTSAPEALRILRTRHYDAIISDYQMPLMDGIEFLKQVRASGNTVPFIIFTGRGREEIVIQAINEGADFYLQKGGEPVSQFTELAHKIRQAVQQRMAQASIRDHERRETDIINFLPDATFAIDAQGVLIAWNRAMEKMTGVPAGHVLGKGNYEYSIPFYHERRPILIDLVLSTDPAIDSRYPYIKREGRTLFSEITIPHFNEGRGAALWFTASPLYDTGGNAIGAIESIREITEWKRTEEALNESEHRFRDLADMLPLAIYEADVQGSLTYANRMAFEIFGYNEEVIGKEESAMIMIAPEDRKRAATALRQLTESGLPRKESVEYLALRKDGKTFPVSIYSSPVLRDGKILGVRGIIIDITERKRQEHILLNQRDLGIALQTAHGMNETLDISLNAAIEISGLDSGGIYRVNNQNGSVDLVISRNLAEEFVNSVSHFPAGSVNAQIVMAGKPVYLPFSKIRIDHTAVQVAEGLCAVAIIPIISGGRSIACLNLSSHSLQEIPAAARVALETLANQIGTAVERIRADEALVESEQRYRNIVEDQTEFICRFRPDGTHVFVNEAYCRYFSLDREDIVGHRFRPEIPPEDRENLKRFFASLTLEHPVNTIVHRIVMPDGRICWQRWSDRAIFDPSGNVIEYQSVGRDISEMKGTEEALRQKTYDLDSRNRLISTLLDTVPIGIFMVEAPSGKPIIANREAARLLGRGILPDATGKNLAEIYEAFKAASCRRYPTDEMPIVRGMRGESHHIDDLVVVRPDGTKIQLEVFGTPVTDSQGTVIASLVSFLDITERKRAEQVIREANRKINLLTSITRHDVGNQVIILRGFTKIALMKKPDPGIAGILEKIEGAVSTIARQIEFTREYQELGMRAPGWQRIRDIVAQQQIVEGISLSCTCDAGVFADPMLERVFFNLIDNAVRHGESVTAIRISCQPDPDGLMIVVGDDGVGVPPALKEKIFEKGYGKNTGFGLFLAREILAITGIIILETGTHGIGARFEIIVPKGMYRSGS